MLRLHLLRPVARGVLVAPEHVSGGACRTQKLRRRMRHHDAIPARPPSFGRGTSAAALPSARSSWAVGQPGFPAWTRSGNRGARTDAGCYDDDGRGIIDAATVSGLDSPLMAQYFHHKAKYPDYVLFLRVGDFYEFFLEDALIASRALDIVLTKRGNDVPMAGVPVHLLHQYLGKLVKQGYKAAICDQVETASDARRRSGRGRSSIIRREVVRLVTPGTITDDFAISPDAGQLNYLACAWEQPRRRDSPPPPPPPPPPPQPQPPQPHTPP
jgi:hypothetical protein